MHRRIETYLSNNGGPVTANDLAKSLESTPSYIRTVLTRELKPESTEGRPWGQPLKKPAGAALNLG